MQSMLLDRATWDLVLDQSRNIAIATEPYAVLQDVCCAVRTLLGECWYDTSKGIPYFNMILGVGQTVSAYQTQVEQAAQTVPLVASALCVASSVGPDRRLSGIIQITLTTGETLSVGIG